MSLPVVEAKRLVLDHLATGAKVADAMAKVGRAQETYRDWRKNDAEFRAKADAVRARVKAGEVAKSVVPDFPEFCERFLGTKVPMHHLRIWDVMEGREPRDFQPSMQYQAGAWPGKYICLNIPPDHAKSTTWTVNYVVWRICKDPNVRVGIVSKSASMAKKFLSQIKQILSSPHLFPELHAAFAPDGGWRSDDKADGLSWREDRIYVKGRGLDDEGQTQKEPTVEALGIGSQIYGTRFDLLLLDDVEDMASASQYEQHANWIGQEVFNRLHPEYGRLVVLGTRVGVIDLYRHLRDEAKTEDGDPFYTYFAQPAILEGETSHSSEWRVLWPERLSGAKIARNKAAMTDQRRFTFVYQQRDVSEYAVFRAEAVDASVNRRRFHGPMQAGVPGHRARGMEGLYVIGSWDPASSAGRNAFICYAVEKDPQKRYVLDVWCKKGVTPRETIALLKDWTVKYGIKEWRIEKNAVQQFITQLPEIRDFLSGHGCRLVEHQTYGNKWDPNMGVEGTLAPLFESCVEEINGKVVALPDGKGRIELPSWSRNPMVNDLLAQLKQWEPDNKRLVQDLVMALWFAELAALRYLRGARGNQSHTKARYMTRGQLAARRTFAVEDLLAARGLNYV